MGIITFKVNLNKETKRILEKTSGKFFTIISYGFIGVVSSAALALFFYWSLSLNSSLYTLINNTKNEPVYLISYLVLTAGAIILFGINVPLFIYRWKKYGPPKFHIQAGSGLGALVGMVASACPVCGSVFLSAVGIAGGIAAFPFGGLELKALSFVLLALPIFLTGRQLYRFSKGKEECPVPKDPSFKGKDIPLLLVFVNVLLLVIYLGIPFLKQEPLVFAYLNKNTEVNPLYTKVALEVLPEEGFQSKIFLGDSVVKLVENGVIDRDKFEDLYRKGDGMPDELNQLLNEPSDKPLLLTRASANYYINILWPLGLANHMSTNQKSPLKGTSLFNFASTGGWTLGKEINGGSYFNKFKILELTDKQEELVTKIANNIYRPCCNVSTFYQDCNHGSALLALLELGAHQGLSEDELYQEALAFNSFWFPDTYIQTALYFRITKGVKWEDVDVKQVLSSDYSSVSGWSKNVQSEIAKIPSLVPHLEGSTSCGV